MKPQKTISSILVFALAFNLVAPLAAQESVTSQEKERDYYVEGQTAAEQDYTKASLDILSGLGVGLLFGLIGWGVGYVIIANMDAEVPRRHIRDLPDTQRYDFEQGYKSTIKKKKSGNKKIETLQ